METHKSLTKIRKEKGWSQEAIAKVLQTTQQQYSKYETGKQEIPVRHIVKLCEFYKVTANKLIGIETYMSEKESNNKFQELAEETEDLIRWAEYQEHITEDQANLLVDNLIDIIKEIEDK